MFLAISKFTEGQCQRWRTVLLLLLLLLLLLISNSTYLWYVFLDKNVFCIIGREFNWLSRC